MSCFTTMLPFQYFSEIGRKVIIRFRFMLIMVYIIFLIQDFLLTQFVINLWNIFKVEIFLFFSGMVTSTLHFDTKF